jgi:hypothetical protein
MRRNLYRAGAVLTFVAINYAAATTVSPHLHHSNQSTPAASVPSFLPAGWTEVCDPAAIGPICRTYPPGDNRWQPTAPLPPHLPLRLPNGK